MAPMRVHHRDGATPERLAPDLAQAVIHARHPASHQRTQQNRGVVGEGRAAHGRDCQEDVAREHPLVAYLAHLTHPVVDIHFGAPQAQRRLTAHRHSMLAHATWPAAVCARAHLLRVAPPEHRGYQAIIVGSLVARMGLLALLPVLGKDLLEDVPVPRGFCHHQGAPSWGIGMFAVQRFSHA